MVEEKVIEFTENEVQQLHKLCIAEIKRIGKNAEHARTIMEKLGIPHDQMAQKTTEQTVIVQENGLKWNFLMTLLKRFMKHAA
ncbi:MAG: hypothetical protein WCL00_10640 [Bacteroidota bacterium]